MDAQLEAEVVPPNRRRAIRPDVTERPHIPDVLEQWLALLRAGWRPGVGHARPTVTDDAGQIESGLRGALSLTGTLLGLPASMGAPRHYPTLDEVMP